MLFVEAAPDPPASPKSPKGSDHGVTPMSPKLERRLPGNESGSKFFNFPNADQIDDSDWSPLRKSILGVMDSKPFDMVMGAIILGNLILIVVETDANALCQTSKDPQCDVPLTVRILNPLLLVIYTIELSFRVFAYRGWYLYVSWNILDSFVVASGLIEFVLSRVLNTNVPNLTVVRVFRILRLLRTVRLLSHFPELYEMMRGFGSAMKAMFWGFTIIVLMLGLWSLLVVEIVHPVNLNIVHEDQWCYDAFESVQVATLFFFQTLVAGDSWGLCTVPVIREYPGVLFIFAGALVSVQLGFTNLILAVIVEAAHQAKEKDYEHRLREKKKHEKECLEDWRAVIESLDEDQSGSISMEELRKGFKEQPEVSKILGLLDVEWQDLETLFRLMDNDDSGDVSYVEFFHCLRKAHSQDMRMYLMNVKLQISRISSLLSKQLTLMTDGFTRLGSNDPTKPKAPYESADDISGIADEKVDSDKHNVHRSSPVKVPGLGQPSPRDEPGAGTLLESNAVPYAVPAWCNAPFAAPGEQGVRDEAVPAERHGAVRGASKGNPGAPTTEVEQGLVTSYKASLDKLRRELEEKLDAIANTAATTAVTLAQNTKSLEALVVSCGVNEGPRDTAPPSARSAALAQGQPQSERSTRSAGTSSGVLGVMQAMMGGPKIPKGGMPPPAAGPAAPNLSSSGNPADAGVRI